MTNKQPFDIRKPLTQAEKAKAAHRFQKMEKKPFLIRRNANEDFEEGYETFLASEKAFGEAQDLFETLVISVSLYTVTCDFGSAEANEYLTYKVTVVVPFEHNEVKTAMFSAESETLADALNYAHYKVWDYFVTPNSWGIYVPNNKKAWKRR